MESSLRGRPQPNLRDLERLRSLKIAQLDGLGHSDRKFMLAGMIMAHVRLDDWEAGLELASRIEERQNNALITSSPATSFLAIEAALAELFIAVGATDEAVLHASRMLAELSADVPDEWVLRALSLNAAAYAMDGEHETAQGFLDQVDDVRERNGWPVDQRDFMDAVAELIVAFSLLDAERINRLGASVRTLPDREPSALSLVRLVDAISLAPAGDLPGAMALARTVARGVYQPSGAASVRAYALGVEALSLIELGTPAEAIALLRDVQSPPNHFICYESIRATAFIVMGDYHSALVATDSCAQQRATHNGWMFPSMLLRRAVANLRLGHGNDAVACGLQALGYMEYVGPQLGLIYLPREDLVALGQRMVIARPDLILRIRTFLRLMRGVPRVHRPALKLPKLSNRERVIAIRMRSGQSYPEIAAALQVSASTVRSQASSIAKKLGASTREDAVYKLEEAGFYAIHSEE